MKRTFYLVPSRFPEWKVRTLECCQLGERDHPCHVRRYRRSGARVSACRRVPIVRPSRVPWRHSRQWTGSPRLLGQATPRTFENRRNRPTWHGIALHVLGTFPSCHPERASASERVEGSRPGTPLTSRWRPSLLTGGEAASLLTGVSSPGERLSDERGCGGARRRGEERHSRLAGGPPSSLLTGVSSPGERLSDERGCGGARRRAEGVCSYPVPGFKKLAR